MTKLIRRSRIFPPPGSAQRVAPLPIFGGGEVFYSAGPGEIPANQPQDDDWRYDAFGSGLRNTSQLNIDWSDPTQHVFFASYEAKVIATLNHLCNNFPYNRSEADMQKFLRDLTGYEAHIYNAFPKRLGYFETQPNIYSLHRNNKYATVNPNTDSVATNQTALVFTPNKSPWSVSFRINAKSDWDGLADDTRSPFMTMRSATGGISNGWTIYIEKIAGKVYVVYYLTLAGVTKSVATEISTDEWYHLHFAVGSTETARTLLVFKNYELDAFSEIPLEVPFTLGASDWFLVGDLTPYPHVRASGAIAATGASPLVKLDELVYEVYESDITLDVYDEYPEWLARKFDTTSRASGTTRLLLHFNDWPGATLQEAQFSGPGLLDASGNDANGLLFTWSPAASISESVAATVLIEHEPCATGIKNELRKLSPILSANHPDIGYGVTTGNSIYATEIAKAISYDASNPNLVTRLIPPHYLTPTELGETAEYTLAFLYTWADSVDELKLFVDKFADTFLTPSPTNEAGVPDQLLPYAATQIGLTLPQLFPDADWNAWSGEQVVDSEALTPLRTIQADVWRRLIWIFPHIIRAKGTIEAIQWIFRALGVEPDRWLNIREWGGNFSAQTIANPYVYRRVDIPFVSFARHSSDESFGTFGTNTLQPNLIVDLDARLNDPDEDYEVQSVVLFGTQPTTVQTVFSVCSTDTGEQEQIGLRYHPPEEYDSFPTLRLYVRDVFSSYVELKNIAPQNPLLFYFGRQKSDTGIEVLQYGVFQADDALQSVNHYHESFSNIDNYLYQSNRSVVIASERISTSEKVELDCRIGNVQIWNKCCTTQERLTHINPLSVGSHDTLQHTLGAGGNTVGVRFALDPTRVFDNIAAYAGSLAYPVRDSIQSPIYGEYEIGGTQDDPVVFLPFTCAFFNPNIDDVPGEHVRIRGLVSPEPQEMASVGQVFALQPQDNAQDDTRLSIEISAVEPLNREIGTLWSDADQLQTILGGPEWDGSVGFVPLEYLARTWIPARLQQPINMNSPLEAYRWMTFTIGPLVQKMLPYKTRYLGMGLVIEPHALERGKGTNWTALSRLGDRMRDLSDGILLTQGIYGVIKRG